MAQPTLYLMLGYPGAGKTTTAELLALMTGAVHLASDKIRLAEFQQQQLSPEQHQALYDKIDFRTEQLLRQGQSVIYDANLNRYAYREEKYQICQRTGAQPLLVWVRVDETVAKERATQKAENDQRRPYGNMAEPMFERLVRDFEPPKSSEPVVKLDGTRISQAQIRQVLKL